MFSRYPGLYPGLYPGYVYEISWLCLGDFLDGILSWYSLEDILVYNQVMFRRYPGYV